MSFLLACIVLPFCIFCKWGREERERARERETDRERDRQRETGRHVFLELFWSPSFGRVGLQEPRKPLWADSWAQLWPALDSETPPTFGSTRPA
jgi:hypothetical protein